MRTEQLHLEGAISAVSQHFGGETYDEDLDGARLNKQAWLVFRAVADGGWYTLAEIEAATGAPQASVSARLRDFRKPRFGAYLVERRRRFGTSGTWEYRVLGRHREAAA